MERGLDFLIVVAVALSLAFSGVILWAIITLVPVFAQHFGG